MEKEGEIMAIKNRKAELTALIEKVPEDKRCIAKSLIDELVFMAETLQTLKHQIKQTGTQEAFTQGKQSFVREAPALTSYTKLISRYSALYKQMSDLLPRTMDTQNNNPLYDFIKGGE